MNPTLIQLLTSNKGRLVSVATGIVVGLVVRALARFGFEVSLDTLNDITWAAGTLATLGIEWAVIKINSDGVKRIQDAIPDPRIKSDGVPGDKTVAAVEKLVSESDTPKTP